MSGGFRPIRHLAGHNTFSTQRFQKSTTADDTTLIYVGDPVKLTSGKVVRYMSTDGGVGQAVLGIVARVLVSEAGRAKVHSLTVNGQHPDISLTADADWFDVYVDPGIVYAVNCDVSAGSGSIGAACNVKVTGRNTAAGISGSRLTLSGTANAGFKIIGMIPAIGESSVKSALGNVECVVNYGITKSTGTF